MTQTNNFELYLGKVETLFRKSKSMKNQALWLYQNDLRTPFFMLEALSKLYANFHNKKKFTKHKERYKRIEDLLGACDYYDSFASEFAKNKKVPKAVVSFLKSKFTDCIVSLKLELELEKWTPVNERIDKIRKKLSEVDWLTPEIESQKIYENFENEIEKFYSKLESSEFNFSDVETHLHEVRRNLRWLSIYAQALQGIVQLIDSKPKDKNLNKYFTEKIVTSKFNVMPDAKEKTNFVIMEKSYFYSLSWIISELGILKDEGLKVIALRDALKVTEKISEDVAFKKACQILNCKTTVIDDILKKGKKICDVFIKEKNLDKMMLYTATTK